MTLNATQETTKASPRALVLDGHELRSGVNLSDTSRFGDDVWDLSPINHQEHLRRNILNFPTLPQRFQLVAKELFYALLVGELPPGEIRLKQLPCVPRSPPSRSFSPGLTSVTSTRSPH